MCLTYTDVIVAVGELEERFVVRLPGAQNFDQNEDCNACVNVNKEKLDSEANVKESVHRNN